MKIHEAIKILKHHNKWRRENEFPSAIDMVNPTDLGNAIDTVVNHFNKPLKIELREWEHTCTDGCCFSFGQDVYLNDEDLLEQNADNAENALNAVLTKLGYDVSFEYTHEE